MAETTGQFSHTLEQIDAAVSEVASTIGESESLNAAIAAEAATVAATAIDDLDVAYVGGSGKYISAISEDGGKISATVTNLATTITSGGSTAVKGSAVYSAISSAISEIDTAKQDALTESQLAAVNSGITANKMAALREEIPVNNLFFTIDILKQYNSAGTWTGNSYERYGVTFEPQADGAVYVHGTSTADAWFKLQDYSENISDYSGFNMSGCPEGGGNTTKYCLQFATAGNVREYDTGSGHVIETHDPGNVWIVIRNGETVDFTFYPMLTNPAHGQTAFIQGAPTNRQLYEMILSIQNS